MYDAKKNDNLNNKKQLKYKCISDRIYFEGNKNTSMINLKTSYIPIDNVLK